MTWRAWAEPKFSKMNDLLDKARLELEEEAERAKLCLKGKRERKEEEDGEEEEHAHQLSTQTLKEDHKKRRKGPSFTWKECVEAATRSRMALPLGRGRGEGGKLGKRDFTYDVRLELGKEAGWARLCPEGTRNRKEDEDEEEEKDEAKEEEHARQLPTQNLKEDNEKQRKGPSFTWKECIEAATRSRMAMPLGGGRRKGGKLSKHDFIYDARLVLEEEAD